MDKGKEEKGWEREEEKVNSKIKTEWRKGEEEKR